MLVKQDWKIIADTADLITSETSSSECIVRIEARENDSSTWDIFKTYIHGDSPNFTEEYRAKNREEAKYIVASLQKEKLLSKNELDGRRLECAKKLDVRMKRQFKDYNVEKWQFSVENDEFENFLYLREADAIEVSILMPEKHRIMEKVILAEVHAILGLNFVDFDLKEEIYYYTTRSETVVSSKNAQNVFLGKVEMGFDFGNE